MDKELVLYQKMESIALLTLNRPAAKNAINTRLIAALKDIRNRIYPDKDIKVVIITGNGDVFSTGTDTEEFSSFANKREAIEFLSITPIIETFERPTIAAINGDALGQGLELTLACDLRVCSDTARFAINHLVHEDIPWDGGSQRLSRLVGKARAIEMLLRGNTIDAQKACQIGLVNTVVPSRDLQAVVMDMAREMAAKGPVAMRYAREAIYKGMDLTLEQGLRLEADLYFLLHTTTDRTEGITAFRNKRVPQFEGQ